MKAYTHRKMELSEAKMNIADQPSPHPDFEEANQCMEVRKEERFEGTTAVYRIFCSTSISPQAY